MSNSSVIDLSKLPTPKVIEELDYEVLFQEYLSDFTARDEEYDGLLESDPAIIILEVSCNIFDCFVISFSFRYSLSFTTATKPETFL